MSVQSVSLLDGVAGVEMGLQGGRGDDTRKPPSTLSSASADFVEPDHNQTAEEVYIEADAGLDSDEVYEEVYDNSEEEEEEKEHNESREGAGAEGDAANRDPGEMELRFEVEQSEHTSWFVYAAAFFVVIASVLGTGILGLPVKLALGGFTPFVSTYTVCLFMQVLVLWYMCELLQRGSASMRLRLVNQSIGHDDENISAQLQDMSPQRTEQLLVDEEHRSSHGDTAALGQEEAEKTEEGDDDMLLGDDPRAADSPDQVETTHILTAESDSTVAGLDHGPDLHSMGDLFLNKFGRYCFDGAVLLHFLSVLISYSLAGSQAYAKVIGIDPIYLLPVFVLGLTLLIIFGSWLLQPIISVMTFAKGTLLVLMVAVTAMVGMQAGLHINNQWLYTGQSFLIGTVALGGAINTLPIVFSRVAWKATDMRRFRWAATGGLFLVYLLNIVWCFYILKIVPQTGGPISLLLAQQEGLISTDPLSVIIAQEYPQFTWVAILIDVFIMVSITVSYITMGTGFKHVLDGLLKNWHGSSLMHDPCQHPQSSKPLVRFFHGARSLFYRPIPMRARQAILYVSSFATVFLIALLNPDSFLKVLEVVTSLALNLESGVFVVLMFNASRFINNQIPDQLHWVVASLRWLVLGYFLYAVYYDIFSVLAHLFA
mmetsp:Transcript_17787/g.45282  ORF Transcript_17787/g.45282 Transcript_17787/m.45282 type:complete len:655 (+) Transcript_17787:119-2083(+)